MQANSATSAMPAAYPARSRVDPHWYVATPAGVVAVTVPQLEDAMRKGHVGAATLVTRAGMPTWYTLGVLTGFDLLRAQVPNRLAEACVAANDVTDDSPVRDERSWVSGVVLGATACLLLVLVGSLALGPRSVQGYRDLAVSASDSLVQHASDLSQRVSAAAERIRRR